MSVYNRQIPARCFIFLLALSITCRIIISFTIYLHTDYLPQLDSKLHETRDFILFSWVCPQCLGQGLPHSRSSTNGRLFFF